MLGGITTYNEQMNMSEGVLQGGPGLGREASSTRCSEFDGIL